MANDRAGRARAGGRPSTGARDALLVGALELIRDRGLAHLTTREVARRAGVSEASVFYHFGDKVGLLQEVVLAGLAPIKGLALEIFDGTADLPLGESLIAIATAQETFFDRALPILESVQADAELRPAFSERMADQDLGPHRGVRLVAEHLSAAQLAGRVRPGVDVDAAATLLVGGCFLRSWQRHLDGGANHGLAPLEATVAALATLLAP